MKMTLQEFLAEIRIPPEKLSVRKLREREKMWRILWDWTDETVKKYLVRIGSDIRVVQRNYMPKLGELGQVHFEPSKIEIAVYEKQYNYNDGKYYYERKIVEYPYQAIMWIEGIIEQTPAEEVEQYEVEPIPEEVEV